ncbi:variable surface protein [Plasmodium gonderi]|uniref:Variable surface protein n=1 Tax=Plasmodium gonderi TaxID=77519 RepID=A0A1Y1JTE9_PLAGO|nr:variable surface protein [Plasmodium gonderi]GAW84407.1 variable surface protein [Plasmodium gonderi]
MGVHLGDDELNNLPTKKAYAAFDKGLVGCDTFHYYLLAKKLLESAHLRNNASDKIFRALCYVYNENKTRKFNSDDCDYLYFWLGDVLYKNKNVENSFYSIMPTLEFFLKRDGGHNICNYRIYDKYIMNEQNFMVIKALYDFSKDYNTLESYFSTPNKSCSDKFRIYLGKCVVIYNASKNRYNDSHGKDKIGMVFVDYFKERREMKLNKLTCNSEENIPGLATREQDHGYQEYIYEPEDLQEIDLALIVHDEEHVVHEQEQSHPVETEDEVIIVKQERTMQPDEESHNFPDENPFTHTISTGSYEEISNSELKNFSEIPNNYSAFASHKAMTIAPLIIGITVFSILLCKLYKYYTRKILYICHIFIRSLQLDIC